MVLLSTSLPYDAARYQDSDAIMLAYMGAGINIDPTEKSDSSSGLLAYNANIIEVMDMIFGECSPQGKLPVNIPEIVVGNDGTISYGENTLYERGFGLVY